LIFIQDDSFLTEDHKKKLNKVFKNGNNFPFYLADRTTKHGDGGYHFIHRISLPEKEKNSPFYPIAKDILETFCTKHKIQLSRIYRCAINITFSNGFVYKCPIHYDHDFFYKQLLLYLNDADGDTVILNKEKKPFKIVEPKKYRAIYTPKSLHYHYFPIRGIRKLMVFTFI